jgi:hypothetical protein
MIGWMGRELGECMGKSKVKKSLCMPGDSVKPPGSGDSQKL